jgi:putative endonuclease
MENFYVYIISSKKNGTLYIGVTNNLSRRMYEHRNKLVSGFTAKYSIARLVYYEMFESIIDAIKREKQLKGWNRLRKLQLIESANLMWNDLYTQSTL